MKNDLKSRIDEVIKSRKTTTPMGHYQMKVLDVLKAAPVPLTVSEVVKVLGMEDSHTRVSQVRNILNLLVKRGVAKNGDTMGVVKTYQTA